MPEHEFELYLSLLKRFLRIDSAQRETIAAELRDHLEHHLKALEARGLPRDAAIREALEEFGDAAELAQHFTCLAGTRKRRLIMRFTFGTAVALAAFGLIATAFWPESPRAPSPQIVQAEPQASTGVPPAAAAETPRLRRRLVRLSGSPAAQTATVLSKHFAASPDVQIIAEPVGNALLVAAPMDMIEEVLATLKELDQHKDPMAFDVTIVEFPLAIGATGRGPRQAFRAREFEGPVEQVRAKLEGLIAAGQVERFKRFHFQTLDNNTTNSEDNEEPSPGAAAAPGTTAARADSGSSRQRVGTIVQVTARVGADNRVTANIVIRDTPISSTAKPAAAGETGGKSRFEIDSSYLGTISLVPGQAIVVNSVERNTASGRSQTIFIVSAEVIDPAAARPVAANSP